LAKFETLSLTLLAALLWVPISIPVAIGVGIVISRGRVDLRDFARGNECLGRPRNPDFLLRPGEVSIPRRAVIQRLAAVADPVGRLPEAAGDGPVIARTDFRFGAKR
jgi:hypothetical protein